MYSEEIISFIRSALKDKVDEKDIDKLIDNYLDELDPIYIDNKGVILYTKDNSHIVLALYDDYETLTKLLDELKTICAKKGFSKITVKAYDKLKDDYLRYGFKDSKEDELELLIGEEWLDKVVKVIVDHPYGSDHPYRGSSLELNYGYVYISESDTYINAYIYGIKEPIEEYTGVVVAVIYHEEDSELRLVVASHLDVIDKDKLIQEIGFEEQHFNTYIYMKDGK